MFGHQPLACCFQHPYPRCQLVNRLTTPLFKMVEEKRYAIDHWEDKLTSIIRLDVITHPKKPIEEYRDGDYVVALFHKKAFKARISEISGKCNGQCIHLSARFTIDKNPQNDTIFKLNMKLNYIFMMSCFIFLPKFLLMFLTALNV